MSLLPKDVAWAPAVPPSVPHPGRPQGAHKPASPTRQSSPAVLWKLLSLVFRRVPCVGEPPRQWPPTGTQPKPLSPSLGLVPLPWSCHVAELVSSPQPHPHPGQRFACSRSPLSPAPLSWGSPQQAWTRRDLHFNRAPLLPTTFRPHLFKEKPGVIEQNLCDTEE